MPTDIPTDSQTNLYFGYNDDAPSLATIDVKAVHPATVLGQPAVCTVIGESHYVGVPALDFHELCSCTSPTSMRTHETQLACGVEHTFRFEGDTLTAKTLVDGRPLEQFPGPDDATVAYRFGPDAWTTIHVGEDGYETYHTYPERGLALYTETELTRHVKSQTSEKVNAADGGDHSETTTPTTVRTATQFHDRTSADGRPRDTNSMTEPAQTDDPETRIP